MDLEFYLNLKIIIIFILLIKIFKDIINLVYTLILKIFFASINA
jgi:hypothetical protein